MDCASGTLAGVEQRYVQRRVWRRMRLVSLMTVIMDANTKPEKAEYVAPEVTAIKLRPEEAVLGFCKSMSAAGQFSSCHQPGGNCHGIGS
jgi:hypothetical protein